MKIKERLPMLLVLAVVLVGGVLVGSKLIGSSSDAMVDVEVPDLSEKAEKGQIAFDSHCAACHGGNAAGSKKGPPLIHKIYNPGHHGDNSFVIAARQGVRQHHWRFGNMPALPQVSHADLIGIITYIRELQTANGIRYEPHRM